MELDGRAWGVYSILKRSTPLMDGLESAKDSDILQVCQEIAEYLKELGDLTQ